MDQIGLDWFVLVRIYLDWYCLVCMVFGYVFITFDLDKFRQACLGLARFGQVGIIYFGKAQTILVWFILDKLGLVNKGTYRSGQVFG